MKIYLVEGGSSRLAFTNRRKAVDTLVQWFCFMFGRHAFDADQKAKVRKWLETDDKQPLTLAFQYGIGYYTVIPLHVA